MFVKLVNRLLSRVIVSHIRDSIIALDPQKNYVLVVQGVDSQRDLQDLREAFSALEDSQNLVVLPARGVKLLELS